LQGHEPKSEVTSCLPAFPERFSCSHDQQETNLCHIRIGDPAENHLRGRGYELEVFQGPEAPPKKKLIMEKAKAASTH